MNALEAARRYLEKAEQADDPGERLYNLRQAHQLLIASEEDANAGRTVAK